MCGHMCGRCGPMSLARHRVISDCQGSSCLKILAYFNEPTLIRFHQLPSVQADNVSLKEIVERQHFLVTVQTTITIVSLGKECA